MSSTAFPVQPEHPTLKKIGPQSWVVKHETHFKIRGYPDFRVPVGFITDGASVPRWAWWFAPPMGGRYTVAAIGHDYLCKLGLKGSPVMSSDAAHEMFRDVMKLYGEGSFRLRVMYRLVKTFGPKWDFNDSND